MRRPHGGLCSFGSNTESENSGYGRGKAAHEGRQELKGRGDSAGYFSPVGDWGGKMTGREPPQEQKTLKFFSGVPCPPDSANFPIMADAQQEIIF